MTPLETSGVFSNDPSRAIPVWKTMRGTSRLTLPVVIAFKGEYRLFQSLPPYVVHSPVPCAGAGVATASSTGVIHQRELVLMTLSLGAGAGAWPCHPAAGRRPDSCPMGLAR